MRKISFVDVFTALALVLVFTILVLGLVACGGDAVNTPPGEQRQTEASPDTTPQPITTAQSTFVDEQPSVPAYEIPSQEVYYTIPADILPDYPAFSDNTNEVYLPIVRESDENTANYENLPTEELPAESVPTTENTDNSTVQRTYPLSKEEARQIGANYILDVFGTDISGMYVLMDTLDYGGRTNTWWGTVTERELDPNARNPEIAYTFAIDGITGERLSIAQHNNAPQSSPPMQEPEIEYCMTDEREAWLEAWQTHQDARQAASMNFFDMTISQQIAASDLTPQAIEQYTQRAMHYARRHFNPSTVTDIQLLSMFPCVSSWIDSSGNLIPNITLLTFTATDDTGREAHVSIPTATGYFGVSISTPN